jgi:hypothetical protein
MLQETIILVYLACRSQSSALQRMANEKETVPERDMTTSDASDMHQSLAS